MTAHVLTWGNCYAEIVKTGYGEVRELWPIPPNKIVKMDFIDGTLFYEIRIGNENKWLSRDKVLHIPGLGFDGFIGYSPIAMARKSIGLGMAMETFGSRYFGSGTHPGVIVSHPGQLSATAHENLKKSLTESYSGLGNTHRLMLLEDAMKIEKIGIPPEESQFLESRQFQIPEIARWFNLPPHKLKDLTKSSFNNIESEQISFVTDSILPWLIRFEQNFNMQLLTPGQYRERLYFKHIVEGLLRGDAKSRAEFYAKMFGIGAMSVNDIREKEDMDPVEGGDVHLVPLNMTTLENAGKIPDKTTEGSNAITKQEPVQTEA
jgi:HK97 family phage portal protein